MDIRSAFEVADQAIESILSFTKNYYVSLFMIGEGNNDFSDEPLSRTCVSYDGEFIYELNSNDNTRWDDLDSFKEILSESLAEGKNSMMIVLSNYETDTSEGVVSISPGDLDYVAYYKYNILRNSFVPVMQDDLDDAPEWNDDAGFLFEYDEEDNETSGGIDGMMSFLSADTDSDIEELMLGIQEFVMEKLVPSLKDHQGTHRLKMAIGHSGESLSSADFKVSEENMVQVSSKSEFLNKMNFNTLTNTSRDLNNLIKFLGISILNYGNLNLYLVSTDKEEGLFRCLMWTIFKSGHNISGTSDDAKELVISSYGDTVLDKFYFVDAE